LAQIYKVLDRKIGWRSTRTKVNFARRRSNW